MFTRLHTQSMLKFEPPFLLDVPILSSPLQKKLPIDAHEKKSQGKVTSSISKGEGLQCDTVQLVLQYSLQLTDTLKDGHL